MSLLNELRARRDEILAIAARNKMQDVKVFGSVARGEDKPESDVDFLVSPLQEASLLDLGGFLAEMECLLKRRVDVVEESSLHWFIRDKIIKEAQPL